VRKRVAFLATFLAIICVTQASATRTFVFTVPPMDQVLDLHGNPYDAQLVIFAAGNAA
jgi:hypothetical protein